MTDAPTCLSEDEVLELLFGAPTATVGSARELHLKDCARCRIFVTEAARASDVATEGSRRGHRTLTDGTLVADRYEVMRFVARGGMGEVYQVRDRLLDQVVALKTLTLASLDDDRALARLKDEVTLARRAAHQNVCRILEFGLHEELGTRPGTPPVPFLTMDFLEGETLGQRIRRDGPLPTPVVRTVLEQLIDGLEAIHTAGIVHRDFKSDNVFLVPLAERGERAVVMDLGLARALDARPRSLTGGVIVGTLDYMAPEQIDGGRPTSAFDIYALGVVTYEMLTGRTPFADSGGMGVAVRKLSVKPPRPSRAGATTDAWDDLVLRCLERSPAKRFATVSELRQALAKLPLDEGAPFRRRSRRARGVLMLVALVVPLGVLASGAPWPTPPPPQVAHVSRALGVQSPAAVLTTPMLSAVGDASTTVPPRIRRPPPSPSLPATSPRPRAPVRRTDSSTNVATLFAQAQSLLSDHETARACAVAERAVSQAPDMAAIRFFLGRCYMRLSHRERARPHYERFLQLAPTAPEAVFVRAILKTKT